MAKHADLQTTMSTPCNCSPNPVVRGARTSGSPAPFDKPHSKSRDTIPVVFYQDNLVGEVKANILSGAMGGQRSASTGRKPELP